MKKTHRSIIGIGVFGFVIFAFIYTGLGVDLPKLFSFSKKNALDEWEEKIFKGRVLYAVTVHRKEGFLKAQSNRAASGIFYKVRINPKEYPYISWKWRVLKFPKKGAFLDTPAIEKDDYAARVYVIFPAFSFQNSKCIEYIWDERLPHETIFTSPYFKNIKLIVAHSGTDFLNLWICEERNIYQDYKKAFGTEPNLSIGAIAIMTDTDNTQSTAEADYDEIKVGYKK